MLTFTGTVQLTHGASKLVNFSFVRELLAFCELNKFEDFFHLVMSLFERLDDLHHFINRLVNRRHGSWLMRWWQRLATWRFATRPNSGFAGLHRLGIFKNFIRCRLN